MATWITENFSLACHDCGEDVVGPLTYDVDASPGRNANGYLIMPPHRESYDFSAWDTTRRTTHPACA